MARLTIGEPAMIETGWSPGFRRVAGRTLPGEMVGRPILSMARFAFGESAMIETGWPPGTRRVAGRTLSGVMVGWLVLDMARLAIRCPGGSVAEIGLRPIQGIVTG